MAVTIRTIKLSENEEVIFNIIFNNVFLANTYQHSQITRSREYAKEQLVIQLPDNVHNLAYSVIDKMEKECVIIKNYETNKYMLNPNNGTQVNILNSSSLDGEKKIPPEEKYPNHKFEFEKDGRKTNRDERITYKYYRKDDDFVTVIIGGKNAETHIIHLGDLHDHNSHIGKVITAINKLENQFSRIDLEKAINDRDVIQNKQPLKAVLDILEHMKLIIKTNQKVDRSIVYSKTDKRIDMHTMDHFLKQN